MKRNLNKQLIDAAIHYDFAAMKRLLAGGADFNALDPDEGDTIFTEAISHGASRDCIIDMIRLGANPNVPRAVGATPLILAVWALDLPLLQMLLDAGADLNTPGFIEEGGMTPLDAVCDGYHTTETKPEHMVLDALELLLKSKGAKCYYELAANA